MTFSIQYAVYKALNEATEKASLKLRSIKGVGSGQFGLTPDNVKNSKEYQEAKKAYDIAFATQRKFNGVFVKKYKKELKALRDEKRPLTL